MLTLGRKPFEDGATPSSTQETELMLLTAKLLVY